MDLIGTTLGPYQIVELIGEGGMARVYKAWQPSLQRYVALKVWAPHLAGDADGVERFQRAAASVIHLRHPHIVAVYDVGVEGAHHYVAMEYVAGPRWRTGCGSRALCPGLGVDQRRNLAAGRVPRSDGAGPQPEQPGPGSGKRGASETTPTKVGATGPLPV